MRNRKALERSRCSNDQGPWPLRARDGKAEQSFDKPDDFAAALRNSLSQAETVELLFAIWEQNVRTVRALNKGSPAGERAETLVAHSSSAPPIWPKPRARQLRLSRPHRNRHKRDRPAKDRQKCSHAERTKAHPLKGTSALRGATTMPHLRPESIPCASCPLRAT